MNKFRDLIKLKISLINEIMILIKRIGKPKNSINSLSIVHFVEQWRWRANKSREKREGSGRVGLMTTHDAAGGNEEEEWWWWEEKRWPLSFFLSV